MKYEEGFGENESAEENIGCNFRKDFKPIVPRLKGLSIELTSRKVNSLEQPPTHVGTELYSQQGVPRRF